MKTVFCVLILCMTTLMGDVVNIRQADPEVLNGILQGEYPEQALELSKGDSFPLTLFLRGDVFELEGDQPENLYVKMNRDLYLCVTEGNCFLSVDNKDWKSMDEFFTGNLNAAIGTEEKGMPFVTIGAELNERVTGERR